MLQVGCWLKLLSIRLPSYKSFQIIEGQSQNGKKKWCRRGLKLVNEGEVSSGWRNQEPCTVELNIIGWVDGELQMEYIEWAHLEKRLGIKNHLFIQQGEKWGWLQLEWHRWGSDSGNPLWKWKNWLIIKMRGVRNEEEVRLITIVSNLVWVKHREPML